MVTGGWKAGATKDLVLSREASSRRLKNKQRPRHGRTYPQGSWKNQLRNKGALRYLEGGGEPEHEAGARNEGGGGRLRKAGGKILRNSPTPRSAKIRRAEALTVRRVWPSK